MYRRYFVSFFDIIFKKILKYQFFYLYLHCKRNKMELEEMKFFLSQVNSGKYTSNFLDCYINTKMESGYKIPKSEIVSKVKKFLINEIENNEIHH